MAVITGTTGNDVYSGTIGVADTAVIDAPQNAISFSWISNRWVSSSAVGTDQLISIEQVQLSNATYQLRPGGTIFLGQSTASTFGQSGSVAVLQDGSSLHTWGGVVPAGTGTSFDVFWQRYSAAGERLGDPVRVNTSLSGAQFGSDVAVLANGDFVITWTGPDGVAGNGIFMQRYSANGTALGGEVAVNTLKSFEEANSEVTALAGGGYIVTWESAGGDGSGSGVFGQIYTASGAAVGSEFRLNVSILGNQNGASIAPLSDGGFAATYYSESSLKFQRYTATGSAVGSEITLGSGVDNNPASAALSGDRVVVVTSEFARVRVVIVDASGTQTLVTKEFVSLPGQTGAFPAVATLSDGGFVVAWITGPESGGELQLQRFDSAGLQVGGVQKAASGLTPNFSLELAGDANGGFVLQYHDDSTIALALRFGADTLPILPTLTGDETNNRIGAGVDSTSGIRINGLQGNDNLAGTAFGDILDGGDGNDVLSGSAGDDIYIADQADRILESLNGGIDTVIVTNNYALISRFVENIEIRGSLAANATGNALDNRITGNARDNQINGGLGADTMIGNAGNDTYFVDNNLDRVAERANEGIDTVVLSGSFTTTATSLRYNVPVNVENVRATGMLAIALFGNPLDNVLVGNNAANEFTGGPGVDVLEGRGGDDTYFISDARAQVIERDGMNGGIDTVFTSVSYTLDDNVEFMQLYGANTNGTGNDQNNGITAFGTSDNVIDGGAGADVMDGGDGSDTYIVDNVRDVVTENGGDLFGGVDEVRASVHFTLTDWIENLTLTGTANIDGVGNAQANTMRGNAGANVLDGGVTTGAGRDRLLGFAGDDTLISRTGNAVLSGGTGADTYIIYADTDTINELNQQGLDTVIVMAPFDYQLGANLENLVLQSLGPDDANLRATGNIRNNQITGNTGNNIIDGDLGIDRMIGGLGDDGYFVDNVGDVVVEQLDEGDDTIYSTVSYTAGANVETLVLIGASSAAGTGNELGNVLQGNSGNNTLSGLDGDDIISGGDGKDSLVGGRGNDILTGGIGNDTLDGGDDIDTANYRRASGNVVIDLAVTVAQATGAGSDRLIGIENVDGSAVGDDTLSGNAGANRIFGLGGNDTLSGREGNDTLLGGEGNDILLGGIGDDRIDGGNGFDTLDFRLVAGNITVDLSQLTPQVTGEGFDVIRNIEAVLGSDTGNDRLTGDYLDNALNGNGGNDILMGGDGSDALLGGAGNDTASYVDALDDVTVDLASGTTIDGFGRNDLLISIENVIGGTFDDTLTGSAENNVIEGGLGRDILRGGGGADTFVYRSASDSPNFTTTRDLILDWATGDKISLSLIDANTVTAGDQAFTFIGLANFGGVAGQLRQVNSSDQVIIEGDIDGNRVADFSIAVKGSITFADTDFVL